MTERSYWHFRESLIAWLALLGLWGASLWLIVALSSCASTPTLSSLPELVREVTADGVVTADEARALAAASPVPASVDWIGIAGGVLGVAVSAFTGMKLGTRGAVQALSPQLARAHERLDECEARSAELAKTVNVPG